jgi:Putative transposase/Transposase zinc-binding domain
VPLFKSCLNRHCPSCQGTAQFRWVEQRIKRLLNTHYFHLAFTLPAPLRPLCRSHPRLLFDLLFSAAARTLIDLARDPKRLGAEIAFSLVLHTWTRDMRFHPHVHGIVTGGGLDLDNDCWVSAREHFFIRVEVLSAVFRGKFLEGLIDAYEAGALTSHAGLHARSFRQLTRRLRSQHWVVYSKAPFGGPEQVVRYLGRYTHRVAISNRRLLAVSTDAITFATKNGGSCTLTPHEFLRRFLLHVLPTRFVKIRHYGLLAPACVNTRLARAQHLLATPTTTSTPEHSVVAPDADTLRTSDRATAGPHCPHCGNSTLEIIAVLGPSRYRHRRRANRRPPPDT